MRLKGDFTITHRDLMGFFMGMCEIFLSEYLGSSETG